MTTSKAIDEDDIDEHDIATAAAHILRKIYYSFSYGNSILCKE
jgi:hypothetical protein